MARKPFPSVTQRLAVAYLYDLVRDVLEATSDDHGLINYEDAARALEAAIVHRTIGIDRTRTRKHGEVLVLTFPLEHDDTTAF